VSHLSRLLHAYVCVRIIIFILCINNRSEIKDCPSVNEGAQLNSFQNAVEKIGFNVLDRAFGVCALNEALLRRSAVHKRHRKYTWNYIAKIDANLKQDIRADAVKYGFEFD